MKASEQTYIPSQTSDTPSTGNFLWEDPPSLDKLSVCVHCGMCLESCPTYLETGQEHHSPRGRVYLISAVAQGKLSVNEAFADPIFTCLDCRACETACPAGVAVGSLIEESRGQVRQAIPLKGWFRFVHHLFLHHLFPYPSRLRFLGMLLRFYQKSGLRWFARKTRLLRLLPKHFIQLEEVLPEVEKPVLNRLPHVIPAHGERKMRVGLLTGCVMDILFSSVNEATIRVLTKNGYEVVLPPGQTCCGALHVHAGDREQGKSLARKNMAVFLDAGVDKILINSAGCGAALKEYPELFRSHPQDHAQAKHFASKVEDISEFLYNQGFMKPQNSLKKRVTYHDACHLAHGQGIRHQPRSLLMEIDGLEWVEMPMSDACCGSAGIYNLTHPVMAEKILEKKMEHVPSEVDWVVMGNPGCMLQMAAGLKKHGHPSRVVHTVQVLDWAYQNNGQEANVQSVS
jgi:glycolate oxidase iron-sulfur subunit